MLLKKIHRGSALISALFIMTLVAIAATAMGMRLQFDIYRTRITILSDKLYLASEAVTFWAISELSKANLDLAIGNPQAKVLDFPTNLAAIYPPFKISGALYDLQSRYNLNNLYENEYQAYYFRLLSDPALKISPDDVKKIYGATRRWIAPYQPGFGQDELLNYYLAQTPPYFPSNLPFHSLSELRQIWGIDAATYYALSDWLTVLPTTTPININTAPVAVLKVLGNGLNDTQVATIMDIRKNKGFTSNQDLNEITAKFAIRGEQLTLISEYYMIAATVKDLDLTLTSYTIVRRNKNKDGKITFSLIRESLNAF